MRVNVLIVEDDPITSLDLSETLCEYGMHITDTVRSGEDALISVQNKKPDVILMDVNLEGELDGVSTVNAINQNNNIPIIYLTANSDKITAGRALQTNPSAFITKPFDETGISYAIELAFNNHLKQLFENENGDFENSSSIFLRVADKYEKIILSDILYIKADSGYSLFVTKEKKFTSINNLKNIWEKLTRPNFIRTHRSFIVNLDQVTAFDNDFIYFDSVSIHCKKSSQMELRAKLKSMS